MDSIQNIAHVDVAKLHEFLDACLQDPRRQNWCNLWEYLQISSSGTIVPIAIQKEIVVFCEKIPKDILRHNKIKNLLIFIEGIKTHVTFQGIQKERFLTLICELRNVYITK